MAVTHYPFSFEATVDRYGVGKTRKVWYTVLFLPDALRAALPFDRYPRLRVEGEVNDVPVEVAFIPAGDGRNYAILGPAVIEGAELEPGALAEMRFRIADQDHVDVPDDLADALGADPAVATLWDALTPGKRRGLAHHVASAKRAATRNARIRTVFEAITQRNGNLLDR